MYAESWHIKKRAAGFLSILHFQMLKQSLSDGEISLRNNAGSRETRIWLTGNGDFASPPRAAGDCLCAVGQGMGEC